MAPKRYGDRGSALPTNSTRASVSLASTPRDDTPLPHRRRRRRRTVAPPEDKDMSHLPRFFVLALGAFLASCTPAPSASPVTTAATQRAVQPPPTNRIEAGPRKSVPLRLDQSDLLAFAQHIGVQCETRKGRLDCLGGKPEYGDIYDVELMPDCGAGGFFGGVVEQKGAELRDVLPPNDKETQAVLSKGQIVCIRAIGRAGQQPSYFYVSTMPMSDIALCKGNRLCDLYGDRAVQWHGSPTPCPPPAMSSACAEGWIDADMVEAFENGL